MSKVLIVDNSSQEVRRLQNLLAREGLETEVFHTGLEGERALSESSTAFVAAFILWDLPGSIHGFDLLTKCRDRWPEMPVVIMSSTLDAAMATRAHALGARDFLERPLDSERILSCLRSLLEEQDPLSPVVLQLRHKILGESPISSRKIVPSPACSK